MSQVVCCPTCQTQYQIKDELAGRTAKCKKCSQSFLIPHSRHPHETPRVAVAGAGTSGNVRADGQSTIHAHDAAMSVPPLAAPVSDASTRRKNDFWSELDADGGTIPIAKTPDPTPTEQSTEGKTQCPHCGAWVHKGLRVCGDCRLDMSKNFGPTDSTRDQEMRKSAMYSLIGIGATLLAAPLFFVLFAMAAGGGLALLVSVLLMQVGVSIGCFSLACQLFKQDPPEPGEILRIVCWSNLPANLLASWLLGGGFVSVVGAAVLAAVFSALVCMLHVGMPVVTSILVSVVYNIFAGILTLVWVLLLMIVFAGYIAVTHSTIPADAPPAAESLNSPQ
jgi:predicted Zn finger-like uncharacterized protein